jgi:nucleotide-binding universal stress UspA family protein
MLLQDLDRIAAPSSTGDRGVHRVLVAFDGSEGAWAALEQAIAVAVSTPARLTIAAVSEMPRCVWSFPGSLVAPNGFGDIQRELDNDLRRCLAEARDEVPAAVEADTVLLHGRPATELAAFAERGHYDLVVTGPRPGSLLRRLFGHSVTRALLDHGHVSVLAVKAPA